MNDDLLQEVRKMLAEFGGTIEPIPEPEEEPDESDEGL